MVGYDIITNKKYQETVPGHTMMFGFTPVKVEYEVADIHDGQITAMTPDGQEKFFNVPEDPEVGEKLVNEFTENAAKGGDQFWIITVVYAPRMVGKKSARNTQTLAYSAAYEHVHCHRACLHPLTLSAFLSPIVLLQVDGQHVGGVLQGRQERRVSGAGERYVSCECLLSAIIFLSVRVTVSGRGGVYVWMDVLGG